MNLTDVTVPYEILIRFGSDGSLKGAHQQRRRIVQLDGEILKDQELPAEPIDVAGMGAVLGEASAIAITSAAALLLERDRLAAERDDLSAMVAAAAAARDAAESAAAKAAEDRDKLEAELAATEAALATARGEIQALRDLAMSREVPPQEA